MLSNLLIFWNLVCVSTLWEDCYHYLLSPHKEITAQGGYIAQSYELLGDVFRVWTQF